MRRKKTCKFVIHRHERRGEAAHWDLMLEKGVVLETYRVNVPPEKWGKEPVEAEKIFDHSLKFLTYEGSVNKGKGSVKIADSGAYLLISQNASRMTVDFAGAILEGEFTFSTGGRRVRRE